MHAQSEWFIETSAFFCLELFANWQFKVNTSGDRRVIDLVLGEAQHSWEVSLPHSDKDSFHCSRANVAILYFPDI